MIQILAPTVIARGLFKFNQLPKIIPLQQFCLNIIEVWTSYILQHTPLLISDGLYQELNYSIHLESRYKLGFYWYGWRSRTFRNITIDSIYILIQRWLSMTQLLLEHSWRSHYNQHVYVKSKDTSILLGNFPDDKCTLTVSLWAWIDLRAFRTRSQT